MTHDEIMALSDDELDHAVAVAQEWELCDRKGSFNSPFWKIHDDIYSDLPMFVDCYRPSTNGSQLLEIMEREKISANFEFEGCWSADNYTFDQAEQESTALGNTINQAVLRCYLASKQGGENG